MENQRRHSVDPRGEIPNKRCAGLKSKYLRSLDWEMRVRTGGEISKLMYISLPSARALYNARSDSVFHIDDLFPWISQARLRDTSEWRVVAADSYLPTVRSGLDFIPDAAQSLAPNRVSGPAEPNRDSKSEPRKLFVARVRLA